jgi:hypothetical protein
MWESLYILFLQTNVVKSILPYTRLSVRLACSTHRVGGAETGKVAPMIFFSKSPEEPGSLECSRQQVRIRVPFRFGKPFAV